MEERDKLKEEAKRIYKETDRWPFETYLRFTLFVSGYYQGHEVNFSDMVKECLSILVEVILEERNV